MSKALEDERQDLIDKRELGQKQEEEAGLLVVVETGCTRDYD